MFKELNPVLHVPLRLAIMRLLVSLREADFNFLKQKTMASSGNLSVQLSKLKNAGYIQVTKRFKDNYPQTLCSVTSEGVDAFDQYVEHIQAYITK